MSKEADLNRKSYLPLHLNVATEALQIAKVYDEEEEEIKLMQLEELLQEWDSDNT